ncbi:hypothetical protein NP233_g8908 [Leucocoprinus birnbaumii]|uniref:Microbial-type PARG catalytic domain-containing protein n=1 Tax=Leucocoprinus birnbaumii TaxID=56174 RepID=A0AAD5YRE2_9AGAR|nr:hypothetical protein NP233_g8908 [Leucocoprinus birnbaumii]
MSINPDSVIDVGISNDRPHPEYFISGGDVHLSARGARFCVFSYFLERESAFWKRVFSEEDYSGSNETTPVIVDEDPEDLANFFWVFYNRLFSIYVATPDQWAGIMRVATKWECPNVQEFAIFHLKTISMDPLERIRIFREFDLPFEEQFPFIIELTSREPLGEIDKAGIDDSTLELIRKARVSLFSALPPLEIHSEHISSICSVLSYEERSQIVAEVFGMNSEPAEVEPVRVKFIGLHVNDPDMRIDDLGDGQEMEAPSLTDVPVALNDLESEVMGGTGWPSEASDEDTAVPVEDDVTNDWEMVHPERVGHRAGSVGTERYARLPIMRHDFILPYCLIISFIPCTQNASDNKPRQFGENSQGQRRGLGKDVLARIADETLKAVENGSYTLRDPQAQSKDASTIIDLRANVDSLKAHTTYYAPDSSMTSWAESPLSNTSSAPTKLWAVEKSTLETSRWLVEKLASELKSATNEASEVPAGSRAHAVGVLNFASARNPGGGFKTGARAQASPNRIPSSLTSQTGQQFYSYNHSITDKGKNTGYYSHAMIYSPSVMVIRSDAGNWVAPFEIDILTSPAVNAGVVRQKRQQALDRGQQVTYTEADMETRIRDTMKERMARVLYLFETQGVKNLVLGSFGTGAFKNKVEMVVDTWSELLLGDGSRFGRSFDRVVFGVIDNPTFVKFAERFGTDVQ